MLGLPYADDSLEFWCLCYVYDAGAYEKINYSNEKYYKLFVDLFDSYVADLPCNVKHILTGQMIAGMGAYNTSKGRIWIITNRISEIAGDNATTVCFPEER